MSPVIMDLRPDRETWRGREVLRLLELVANERRYFQEIIAALPVPLAIAGADGEVHTSNRCFQELFHVRAGDSRRRIAEILESQELQAAIESAFKGVPSQLRLPAWDDHQPLNVSVTPLRGWGNGHDWEALLTVLPAAFKSTPPVMMPEGVPAVLWSMDPHSLRFMALSGDCGRIFGAARDHWIDETTTSADRVHPSQRADVIDFYRRAIAKGGFFSCEFRTAAPTLRERWSRDSFRVVRQPEGRVQITGVTVDVTGRRRADEHSVQAQRADALIGLSRRLAHDLNNALMIISGYGEETLASFAEPDPRRSDVQALMTAAETIAGVAGELQGFTRTQATSKSAVPIDPVLRSVSARIRSQLGAVLVTRLLDRTLTAAADPGQMEAVLFSVARALRHSADPHMILFAGRKRVSDYPATPLSPQPGEYVEIVFRAPENPALDQRAFEKFIAGRDPHGSDLARAYAIIRDWGGWICTGHIEHGTEVRIMLPPAAMVSESAASAAVHAPEPAAAPPPIAAKTVLVVEDEDGIRALIRRILEREGYRVLDASSAAVAGEAAKTSTPPIDLLITDVQLPGESGTQLAARLQAARPQLRVIYMSGYTVASELETPAAESPAFLRKPFTRNSLVKQVQEALAE